MNGVPLQRVDEIRDLRVIITSSLSWNNHINNIISKAACISGLIKRTLEWHASSQTKYILYCSLVRPLLEYCTVVWSGTSRKNIKNIEKIQRSMTRYVFNYAEVDYKDRLLMPKILPLTMRREYTDIVSSGSVYTVIMMLMLTILLVFSLMVDAPLVTRLILDFLW